MYGNIGLSFGATMRFFNLLFLLGIMVIGSACDPIFGVSRDAYVLFMPEPARVGDVIRHTPKVTSVEFKKSERRGPLTYTFVYHGNNIDGTLEFVQYKHRVEYSQFLLRMGFRPPQECIDATRPVMIAIEKGLEENCGLTNLRSNVRERCHGVKCPARESMTPQR